MGFTTPLCSFQHLIVMMIVTVFVLIKTNLFYPCVSKKVHDQVSINNIVSETLIYTRKGLINEENRF